MSSVDNNTSPNTASQLPVQDSSKAARTGTGVSGDGHTGKTGGQRFCGYGSANAHTESFIILKCTREYIAGQMAQNGYLPCPDECADEVLIQIKQAMDIENSCRPKGEKIRIPKDLPDYAIAELMLARDTIIRIAPGLKEAEDDDEDGEILDESKLPLGVYQGDGPKQGIYQICNTADDGELCDMMKQYNPKLKKNERFEVFSILKSRAPVVRKTTIPYLVPVRNGIYDLKNKQLLPFGKDYVFTTKIRTGLNLAAVNPQIYVEEDGTYWNPEDWMQSLSPNDPELVDFLWEIIWAACTPLIPRNKMVLLYSRSGNNGKGTLCELIRTVIGKNRTASITLLDFGKSFGLSSLPDSIAVIVDENNVKSYIEELAALKAAITGDVVTINIKNKPQYDYSYNGLILQCVNCLPKINDKTGSFKRRLLIVEMPSCFTGVEKKYIKNRLIHRRDVREYVLKRVLVDMPYKDSFSEPECCKKMMREYALITNSVDAFLDEILPQCKWDLLPATDFLYEGYCNWYRSVHPGGNPVGRNEFIEGVKDYINNPDNNSEWEWTDSTRSKGRMDWDEPLMVDLGIRSLYYDAYDASRHIERPTKLKLKYSGLKRLIPSAQNTARPDEEEAEE